MSNPSPRLLDFVIDKLTSSIENIRTGEIHDTRVMRLYPSDSKLLISQDWLFDWHREINSDDREVFALTTISQRDILQGLMSISDGEDHVFMNLIESAEFNVGKNKLYEGVAGNLVAFACYRSIQLGYDGAMAFEAKTQLIGHYEKSMEAKRIGANRMFIPVDIAHRLVQRYSKSLDYDGPKTAR